MNQKNKEKTEKLCVSKFKQKENYLLGINSLKKAKPKNVFNINGIENSYIKNIFNKSEIRLTSIILSFLAFKEILELKRVNKYFTQLLSEKKILREYALNGNFSPENRLIFYKTFINIEELKNNLISQFSTYLIQDNIYNRILSLARDLTKSDEKFRNIHQQINKDINRTFYTDKFKYSNGKEMLDNILTLIAFIRPEIGYCQGMNFIVGALINFINDEETCFWIFLHFIDNIKLKDLYLQNMPEYLIKLYQINFFIKEYYPKMHHHLKTTTINLDIFLVNGYLLFFLIF